MKNPYSVKGRLATAAALGAVCMANAQNSNSCDSVQIEPRTSAADRASSAGSESPTLSGLVSSSQTIHFLPVTSSSKWTQEEERLFDDYALKDALGTATHEESQLLEALGHRRDRLLNPLSYEQIMRRKHRDQLEEQLLEAVSKYVSFFQNYGGTGQKKR